MEFKEKLKELRKTKGISQEALAKEVLVSRSQVAKWENGLSLPNGQSLELLSQYFGVDQSELISDTVVQGEFVRKNSVISKTKRKMIVAVSFCVLLAVAFTVTFSVFFTRNKITDQPIGGSVPLITGLIVWMYSEEARDPYDTESVYEGDYALEVGKEYLIKVLPNATGGSREVILQASTINFYFDEELFAIERLYPEDELQPYFKLVVLKSVKCFGIMIQCGSYYGTLIGRTYDKVT